MAFSLLFLSFAIASAAVLAAVRVSECQCRAAHRADAAKALRAKVWVESKPEEEAL